LHRVDDLVRFHRQSIVVQSAVFRRICTKSTLDSRRLFRPNEILSKPISVWYSKTKGRLCEYRHSGRFVESSGYWAYDSSSRGVLEKGGTTVYLRKYDVVHMAADRQAESGGGIHPFHEILIITSGSVLLKWMGRDYAAHAPAVFLLAPNTPHLLVKQSAACGFAYMELDMQDSAVEFPNHAQMLAWNELQCSGDRHAPELTPIYSTASCLCDVLSPHFPYESAKEQVAELDIRKMLLLVTSCLQARFAPFPRMRESSSRHDKDETRKHIQALMRYMESSYFEPITVNMLADSVHLDVSYFIRLFRSITGTTPLQYLQDLRMNAASCFLSTTAMHVQEVAAAVGIPSIHYFSRLFKQTYGVSPTQWRERERNASACE